MRPPASPRRRRGALTEDDRAVWEAYARAVRPLEGRAAPVPALEPATAPAASVSAPPPPPERPLAAPAPVHRVAIGVAPGGLDRATWQRLRGGRMAVDRTLDLHGMTAERAHRALHSFLLAAVAEGMRCVEVVTGRGAGEGGGVLRREVPEWLNAADLRGHVLAVVHPHARNQGALRILLRRLRG